jgi:hypothetical protein
MGSLWCTSSFGSSSGGGGSVSSSSAISRVRSGVQQNGMVAAVLSWRRKRDGRGSMRAVLLVLQVEEEVNWLPNTCAIKVSVSNH